MQIISVVARKGGTGKSTACRALAVEALQAGLKTAIIDTDPQGTCLRWSQRRASMDIHAPYVEAAGPNLTSQAKTLEGRGVDILFIDTPPTALPVVSSALLLSTAALIVTRPSMDDLESVQETVRVASAQGRPFGVCLWQTPPDKRVRIVSLAVQALTDLVGTEAICPTTVSSSVSYQYAYAESLTVQEREPHGRARAELADVWSWMQRKKLVALTSYDTNVKASPRPKKRASA